MARYDYFAWYTYDLRDTANRNRYISTVRTGELRYFHGHQHGVRPTPLQLQILQVALVKALVQEATAQGVPYPGTDAVLARASLHTRSQRA